MPGYKGKISTSGTSEAIRLSKSLFLQHPEFKQQADVIAHVIGPGQLLVSLADPAQDEEQEDPIVSAFLSFLEKDMTNNPSSIKPLDETLIARMKELTNGIEATDSDLDDVSL
jgi:antitoxin PrlF